MDHIIAHAHIVVSEGDVFSSKTSHSQASRKKLPRAGEIVKSFSDVSVGDYVVHEKYGIGIYRGLEKIVGRRRLEGLSGHRVC